MGKKEGIVQPMVLIIAVGQVFIAMSTFMKRRWFRVGCIGGISFCLAIAPLGMGAAFPSTLLMAFAFGLALDRETRSIFRVRLEARVPACCRLNNILIIMIVKKNFWHHERAPI